MNEDEREDPMRAFVDRCVSEGERRAWREVSDLLSKADPHGTVDDVLDWLAQIAEAKADPIPALVGDAPR